MPALMAHAMAHEAVVVYGNMPPSNMVTWLLTGLTAALVAKEAVAAAAHPLVRGEKKTEFIEQTTGRYKGSAIGACDDVSSPMSTAWTSTTTCGCPARRMRRSDANCSGWFGRR